MPYQREHEPHKIQATVVMGPGVREIHRELAQLVDDANVRLQLARARHEIRAVDFIGGQLSAYRTVLSGDLFTEGQS
ncbi:hypothetical protein [Fodinicola feengrottensis]|uniref:hypothetical protein n=1 Tax=Fodinicola feengrottensis TaxID=435914 RepID=UPI0013D0EBC1|nr:hypothetical protein [Fodinicola feengrottensis]